MNWLSTCFDLFSVRDVLRTNKRTNGLLDDYPNVPTNVPPLVNDALGSFLRAKLSHQIKGMLIGVDPKDGVGILPRIQSMYAPASLQDRGRALTHLSELQMNSRDSIASFIRKFRKALKAVSDVSLGHKPQDPVEIAELFIRKCLRGVDKGSDERNVLLFYQRVLAHRKPDDPLPFTLSKLEFDLCQCESERNNDNRRPRDKSNRRND